MKSLNHFLCVCATLSCIYILKTNIQAQYTFTGFDINPGVSGTLVEDLTSHNNLLFFADRYNNSLGISDGTIAGTHLIQNCDPMGITSYNGMIYFSGWDNNYGMELWVSDGTSGGTMMLKDIYEGMNDGSPSYFTEMNGKLYFSARQFATGAELWVTDGTVAGTTLVKDIHFGIGNSWPINFTVWDNKLYFNATDPAHGSELWVSDGTEAGTYMLIDLTPGPGSSDPFSLTTIYDKFYFRGNYRDYVSDGTVAGTVLLGASTGYNPNGFTGYNGLVYYADEYGVYRTDGTPAGTFLFKNGTPMDTAIDFTEYNGLLYFAMDGEPWVTDGTLAGTYIFKDSICIDGGPYARNFAVFDNKLFFAASDINTGGNMNLYVSDGTEAGTHVIMPPSINMINPLNESYEFLPVNDQLFFKATYDDIIGTELWKIGSLFTGMEEEDMIQIKAGPNPVNDVLNIYSSSHDLTGAILSLTTIDGKRILTQPVTTSSFSLDMSSCAAGIYLLSVQKENHLPWVMRVIKK